MAFLSISKLPQRIFGYDHKKVEYWLIKPMMLATHFHISAHSVDCYSCLLLWLVPINIWKRCFNFFFGLILKEEMDFTELTRAFVAHQVGGGYENSQYSYPSLGPLYHTDYSSPRSQERLESALEKLYSPSSSLQSKVMVRIEPSKSKCSSLPPTKFLLMFFFFL
jgi:hypothetical protein